MLVFSWTMKRKRGSNDLGRGGGKYSFGISNRRDIPFLWYSRIYIALLGRDAGSNTPKQQANLFEQKLSELEQEQELLRLRMKKLQRHIEAVKTLEKLRQTPYQETEIDTECIVSFELIEQEKLLQYIEDPYLYSRIRTRCSRNNVVWLSCRTRAMYLTSHISSGESMVVDMWHFLWKKKLPRITQMTCRNI